MTEQTHEKYEDVEVETLTVPLTNGKNQVYAILDYFDFEGKKYAIVSPVDDNEISEEVTIFGYKEDGRNVIVEEIRDDRLFNRIAEAYNNA